MDSKFHYMVQTQIIFSNFSLYSLEDEKLSHEFRKNVRNEKILV